MDIMMHMPGAFSVSIVMRAAQASLNGDYSK
jgi:hypothetical protein